VPNIGPTELIIVLVIVLLVFGPKRLPGLGRQLGSGMREFKDSITGKDGDDDDGADRVERPADPDAADRRQANAALGRPEDETQPVEPQAVDGDAVPDRPVR
jgi:sec-independent protein translocase protein TatA